MKYETVIFDLDGTLLDTLEDLKDAANHELRQGGDPERTLEEVRTFVGNGLRMLMVRALPQGRSEEEIDRRTASMKAYYAENACHKTRPYPGILTLLERLKAEGVTVAVVSNKMDGAVKTLCATYLPGLVDLGRGEVEGVPRKPAPDMVELALRQLGKEKAGAVYVGDSEVDIATARNAGIPCLSVTWGFRPRAVLEEAGAAVLADTPEQLLAAMA